MSKPPFKSGGPKRGGGSGSRDGSFRNGPRGDAPRGRGARDDNARGDKPAYGRGPRTSGDAKPYGDRNRDERPRSDRRDERGGERRSGERKPYGDRPAADAPRGRGPRSDDARGEKPAAYGRGARTSGDAKPYGDRNRDERPRSDRRDERGGERRSGERKPYGDRPAADAPRGRGPRSDDTRGEKPAYGRGPRTSGDAKPYGDRNRDERGGERRSGERKPFGDRPRDDRPRNDRPRDDRRDERRTSRPPVRSAPRAAAPTPKTPGLPEREGERIAKLLARAGIASRREVERMIIEGRVKLDDQVIDTPSTVLTSLAGVSVDGTLVGAAEDTRLFIFHKPSGLLTAERDMTGRPTIYTALHNAMPEGAGRVMPIGRLDLNTEGLLLLTNDGAFKRQLELPATGIPRTYRARTFGDITQSQLEDLIEGIEVDGVIYGKIDANMERRTGRNQWIEMTLTEGKNREVRRVLEHLDLQVSRLIRISYGPFRLLDLPKGMVVEVSQRELENFRRTLPEDKA